MVYFLVALTIIMNFILQGSIFQYFGIFGVVPNTALIIVVIIALAKGKFQGGFFGIVIGLIQDIMFSTTIGINSFIYFVVGYFIGFIEDTFARDNIINPIIFTAISTVFYNITYSLFIYFLTTSITFINAVKSVFSFEVIYNSIVSIFIYKLFQKIFAEPTIRFRKR